MCRLPFFPENGYPPECHAWASWTKYKDEGIILSLFWVHDLGNWKPNTIAKQLEACNLDSWKDFVARTKN